MDVKVKSRKSFRNAGTRTGGYTLIELLVAVGIFGSALSGLMSTVVYSLTNAQATRENLRAAQLLLEKSESLQLYSWGQLVSSEETVIPFDAPFNTDSVQETEPFFTGTITISTPQDEPDYDGNLKLATITVNWRSGDSTRTQTIKTYVSRYGLQNYLY